MLVQVRAVEGREPVAIVGKCDGTQSTSTATPAACSVSINRAEVVGAAMAGRRREVAVPW